MDLEREEQSERVVRPGSDLSDEGLTVRSRRAEEEGRSDCARPAHHGHDDGPRIGADARPVGAVRGRRPSPGARRPPRPGTGRAGRLRSDVATSTLNESGSDERPEARCAAAGTVRAPPRHTWPPLCDHAHHSATRTGDLVILWETLHDCGFIHSDPSQRLHLLGLRPPPAPGRAARQHGRVASSVDNSMIECFWSTMQRELLDTRRWTSKDQLAGATFEWIGAW